ncbi:MAG: ribosome-associated translation inhibitor RaiA [Sciscionella sp.]|nr:ribosome-associated translation inhibitor RaiA [Sciscionella sp.]
MDIVVKGRNVEVPEHYRVHVAEKLAKIERYVRKSMRVDVELFHERNRRQAKNCQRVEITAKGKGPAVRAEGCAGDFYAALDCAVSKLENRMRRMHDRRRVHHGRRSPASVGIAATSELPKVVPQLAAIDGHSGGRLIAAHTAVLEPTQRDIPADTADVGVPEVPEQRYNDGVEYHEPGRVVREKEHPSKPITVDQALYEMELVGHDFYLFLDVDSGKPSVVYRRKGFDYGVIRLT